MQSARNGNQGSALYYNLVEARADSFRQQRFIRITAGWGPYWRAECRVPSAECRVSSFSSEIIKYIDTALFNIP